MTRAPDGPSWPLWAMIPLLLGGAGVGVYMTKHHEVQLYGGVDVQMELVGCAEAAGVNCDIVNTSEWSELLSVPLFTWAIGAYLALAVAALLAARGRREIVPWLTLAGVGASLFSAFLYYISVVEIGYVCLWCMRLYGLNGLLLVLSLVAGGYKARSVDLPAGGQLLGAFALLMGLSVGGQRAYRASLVGDGGGLATGVVAKLDGDPSGPAPQLAFEAVTEDKNTSRVVIEPDDAWKGNPNAKVAVIEFADLECGYCKRASSQLSRLYEAYGDRVVFVFKHFPLDPACNVGVKNRKHANACNAAVASVCAQDQGQFWAYHDLAFKNQHQLSPEALRGYAARLKLDMEKFDACLRSPAAMDRVRADTAHGKSMDVHGTPRVFINGELYRAGSSAEQMAKAIEVALGADPSTAAKSASALSGETQPIVPIPADVPEMREVRYGDLAFRIDTFEAAVVDGKALSGKHQIPALRMSWHTAKAACEAAGKRMCSEAEWIAACQGAAPVDDDGNGQFADDQIEGTSYPYGDLHERARCWEGREGPSFRPVYTGEMPGCASRDGVYDLTGNMEEWVGDSAERAVLLGGGFDTPEEKARCYRRNDTFGSGYANRRTGFRCCANL